VIWLVHSLIGCNSVTSNGVVLPEVDDPDFMNWMRPAGFNRFRKLYRIIDEPIAAGEQLIFTVNNGTVHHTLPYHMPYSIYACMARLLARVHDDDNGVCCHNRI
jgi:hypothetical protein